ncbi:hypothetical protein U91I_00162 [alpha proteobacterium U9-1i]|nr:hypothetical protein U91I_00162 [alpha proteobacterium U9-1i]
MRVSFLFCHLRRPNELERISFLASCSSPRTRHFFGATDIHMVRRVHGLAGARFNINSDVQRAPLSM